MSAYCKDSKTNIFGFIKLNKSQSQIVVGCLDGFIIIIFFIYNFWCQRRQDDKTTAKIRGKDIEVEKFAIQLTNYKIDEKDNVDDKKREIKKYLDEKLK